MRNREIAMLIGTSCETVKKQVHSVFTKLGVSTRAELAGLVAAHRPP
jgi:DNA-binding NarL/FixJ family response regulator